MDEENKEKKVTPPEEYTALKMAKDVIDKLLKIIVISLSINVIIVISFLLYNHFTVSQITTTLTAEPDSTAIITGGNESPVTEYPNTNSNKNVSTNK